MSLCKEQAISEGYADFIIRDLSPFPESISSIENICSIPLAINHTCVYAPLEKVLPLSINKYPYASIPSLYTVESTAPLEDSGILRLQNQPFLNLKGQGTLIGIVDTGIDYTHEAFIDSFGNSKIESIWDQTNNNGTPPVGQNYGTEYTNSLINAALGMDNPRELVPVTDENGHGTFLAGVACGSENIAEGFIGAAPEARLVVVKLKPAKQYLRNYYFVKDDSICYQENDIMFAISYLLEKQLSLNMPMSIIIGLGSSRGEHNGTSNLSFLLNRLTEDTNCAICVSMGNEGNKRLHFQGNIINNTISDTIELRIDSRQKGVYMEIWGDNPQVFSISVTSPTGEVLNRIPPRLNASENYTFLFEQTVLQVEYKLVEPYSGSELILLRFINPTAGLWQINVYGEYNIAGTFNSWLPISLLLYEDTYFLRSSPYITLTNPASSLGPISISTYNSFTNSIYFASSRGYNKNGTIKPDICSPGVNITGPRVGGGYTVGTGSSLAAALTAGAAALFQTWGIVKGNNMELKNSNIKSYMIRGATRQNNMPYPNEEWGYGALNIYDSFEVMRGNIT